MDHFEKHRHTELHYLQRDFEKPKIVLAGNPNVGKSLVFNILSGLSVEVSNYPGTTVELTKGSFKGFDLFDSPGIYGVSSFSDEERVSRDIILDADVVINIVDAKHLERDLFLTQQLIDMGKKLVVLLNFMDELPRHQIEIDVDKLRRFLGVDVIPVSAARRTGFDQLENAIGKTREGFQREELHADLHRMLRMVGSQAEALLILEGDEEIAARHGVPPSTKRDEVYIQRRNRVNYIVNQVVHDALRRRKLADVFDRMVLYPLSGIPLLFFVLLLTYFFVGKFVAQDLVGFTEIELGKNLFEPWIRSAALSAVPQNSVWYSLLVGEFGILTTTVTYLVFLLLPLVAAFYAMLALLEDSGYLPRLATMMDRSLHHLGLNGRAVIPLILGFGCVTSATITTRILNSPREKFIATVILQFAIPCSAQLAVIAALLAGAGFVPMLVYGATIFTVLVALGTGLNKILQGEPTPLLLDLPPMRFPRLGNVITKTLWRTYGFMKEASLWFFVGAVVVALADYSGTLRYAQSFLKPLVTLVLQLPPETATAFIMGVIRRDFGAAGLYQMTLTPMQITVSLITITLFVPCIASLMVMMKECGVKTGFAIWMATWVAAFVVGGLVSHIVM
jgi:ferrous iron transport protein B